LAAASFTGASSAAFLADGSSAAAVFARLFLQPS